MKCGDVKMNNTQKALFGSWIQAIGTVLSAIGSTPSTNINNKQLEDLNLWGNVLQATGNAVLADTEEELTLNKVGNMVQSIGNSTVLTGLLIDFPKIQQEILDIQGNWLQAVGGGVSFVDALEQEPSTEELYNIYGNLLQAIGNSLQAISGILELKDVDSTNLNVVGSWIQAIGSVISFLGQLKSSL